MHRPSCTSYQLGLITTTRFTPTRHSDIVHPVSSSQLTEVRDRVRSFGGYNTRDPRAHEKGNAAMAVFLFLEASQPCGTTYRLGLGCFLHPTLASMVAV